MYFTRQLLLASIILLHSAHALAGGFVLGAGVESDSASGRALSSFADFGVSEKTWLSTTLSVYQTDGLLGRRNTTLANVAVDHWFEPIGFRAGVSYWGNSDILESVDMETALYYRDQSFMFSVNYERREFDFVVLADFPALRRTAEFSANGIGLSSRFPLGENASFHIKGVQYDYSRNIRLQPDIDALRFFSTSRLSMINSLIDHSVGAGVEFEMGLRSLDFSAGSWQTAVDGGRIDSYSIGFLTPWTDRSDLEMRFSVDHSENYGQTMAISVYLYYFGGT